MPELEHIGRYEVVSRISAGGMGSVYLARDPTLNRQVAVKLLLETLDSDDWRKRFRREAEALARLTHPNIVTIFDFGESDAGRPFIVMEYVRGRHLGELIGTPLPLVEKLALLEDLCQGLDYAHQAGIAHLDVKPANLIVGPGGRLTIVDFGIARTLDARSTLPEVRSGTPSYMAPEQITGEAIGPQADQFAAGAVAYELLSGRRAFQGSVQEVVTRICAVDPPPLSQLCRGIDPELEAVVARALRKGAASRFPSIAVMARSIARIRERLDARNVDTIPAGLPSALTTVDAPFPIEPSVERVTPSTRRAPVRWALGAAVIAAAVIVAVLKMRPAPSSDGGEPTGTPGVTLTTPPAAVNPTVPPRNGPRGNAHPPRSDAPVSDSPRQGELNRVASLFEAGNRDVLPVLESALLQYPDDPELREWLARVENRARQSVEERRRTVTATAGAAAPAFSQAVQAEREATDLRRRGMAAEATRKLWQADELLSEAAESSADAAGPPAGRESVTTADDGAVRQALQGLATAYSSLAGAAVKAAYPGLTTDQVRTLDRSFLEYSAYRLDIKVLRVVFRGSRATATCTLDAVVSLRNGSERRSTTASTFTLESSGGSWTIVSASKIPN